MSTFSKGINMLFLSIVIMALLITTVLGFMLGFSHPLPWILIAFLIFIPYIHEKIISKRYIQWHPSMSVGIDLIDNDHKKLLGLINQLQTATQYEIDDQLIDKIMHELINYTKYHFDREEYLMQINQYPDFENHKIQHKNMIQKMEECMRKYKSDPSHTIDDALSFLKNWLINHINICDKEYVPYLKNIDLTGHNKAI